MTRIIASSSSEAPWQSNFGLSVMDEEMYGNQPPTVFAPGGRLYSVERTVAAASSLEDPSSNLVVALSCREGLVIVTTSTSSPHLDISMDQDDDTTKTLWITREKQHRAPLSRLSSNTWLVTGGNAVHSSVLRFKICRWAEGMHEANDGGQPLPSTALSCAALARKVSDYLHEPTQTTGKAGPILAVCCYTMYAPEYTPIVKLTHVCMMLQSYALLAGRDERNLCCLWRVDPTGQFWKCDAAVIGRGAGAAEAHLMNLISARGHGSDVSFFFTNLSSREALSTACECIGKVLPKDNKSHWQAFHLRASSNDEQASCQILHGNEIQSLLNSTPENDADSDDNKITRKGVGPC